VKTANKTINLLSKPAPKKKELIFANFLQNSQNNRTFADVFKKDLFLALMSNKNSF
jgi:hypothetical protein